MDQAQLLQVEKLCLALYQGTSSSHRTEAQQQLLTLQSTADFIPQCQFILDQSSQPYAQLVASTSLESLFTQFWNNFSLPQKLELRNYIMVYIANHATNLEEFVLQHLTKLNARVTKLGWFDAPEFREIVEEIGKFLDASIDHNIVGMRMLMALVDDMNTQTTGRTLTLHRKTSMSFRDQVLLQIFQVCVATLRSLQQKGAGQVGSLQREKEFKLINICLNLAGLALSFDFIGTNPEESSEDVGTVQVPSTWRAIVQDVSTMQLFFDFYHASEPPRSNAALEVLVQLSSVRRSLFSSEKERTVFLQTLMTGIQSIMQSKKGLEHIYNYHEFCRLLGRLKASYQLSELVKTSGFTEWLELAGDFTIKSLQNWRYSMNSIHYLLALWGRLVAALPYLRNDIVADSQRQAQTLRQCVLQVVQSYIQTMLESVDIIVASEGSIEDPLEDEGSLREQMERLPVIARLQYDTVAQYLLTMFEQALTMYEGLVGGAAAVSSTAGGQQQIEILEGKMTWLTYMIAAVIDTSTTNDSRKSPTDLVWDGRLSRCIFRLLQVIDYRMNASQGTQKPDEKLEVALLFYFKAFKRVYLVDGGGIGMGSSLYGGIGMGMGMGGGGSIMGGGGGLAPHPMSISAMTVPGGLAPHPLLSLALSNYNPNNSTMNNGNNNSGNSAEKDSNEIVTIYDAMGVGDMIQVMNILVNKLCRNIKYWHRSDRILEETLEVFVDLVSSYSSSKTLLSLETVHFLVHNHTGQHFPFLGYDNDNKYRITFYSALSRLVFSSSEDLHNSFDAFLAPNLSILGQLQSTSASELRSPSMKIAIIAALRDLRGITVSSYNKRTYNLLFDSLYPAYFPFFRRVAETWYDDPVVMTALMKFLQEFVANKSQRIYFENSSANGILLFRETSAIICTYGSQILSLPLQQNIYLEKYKGIRLMLNVLTHALSGNYVNFGVFALYQDTALQNVLDVSLQICLQIPLPDVMAYVKLSRAYFAYLEILFRNHLDSLAGLDSAVFLQLLKTNQEGLQSSELTVSANCASTIDHVATYLFLHQNRDGHRPTAQRIRQHLLASPSDGTTSNNNNNNNSGDSGGTMEIFNQLMATLFNALIFGNQANQWAMTRPILSVLLASEASYAEYQQQLIATQPPENHEKLREEFTKLTADIQRSVETSNRDKFTQKLSMFRLNVRQFLAL